jgi:hypothetical protein
MTKLTVRVGDTFTVWYTPGKVIDIKEYTGKFTEMYNCVLHVMIPNGHVHRLAYFNKGDEHECAS